MNSHALALAYIAGSLYLFSTSILGWQIAKLWLKRTNHLFFLALYFFAALLGTVIYLTSRNYPSGWIIASLLTLVSLVLSVLLHTKFAINLFKHLPDGLVIICSVLGLLVSPILIFSSHHYHVLQAETTGKKALQTQLHQLESLSDTTQVDALGISKNSQLPALMQLVNPDKLKQLTQQEMVLHQLDFLTILDRKGAVLVRAHQPTAGGDLYAARFPWITPVFAGQSISGFAWNEANQPVSLSALPIKDGSVIIGSLVTGHVLSDATLLTSATALASTNQVIATGNSLEKPLFNSVAFDNHLRQQAFSHNKITQEEVSAGTTTYLYSSQEVPTLESNRPLRILALTHE